MDIRPFDIHAHWCVFDRSIESVARDLEFLEERGFGGVALYPLPIMRINPRDRAHLIPGDYVKLLGAGKERAAHEDDLETWMSFRRLWRDRRRLADVPSGRVSPSPAFEVISFLDIRAWDGRFDLSSWWDPKEVEFENRPTIPTAAALANRLPSFHAGLKDILILEEDGAKMRMPPLRLASGMSRDEYYDRHRRTFELAERLCVPLVYHVDLNHHGSFVEECLAAHPGVRVNIPHFGFSRHRLAELFRRHPGVVTDISNMASFIRSDSAGYRRFILEYPDRVLLGSDVVAGYNLRGAVEHADVVRELRLPDETEAAVLATNASRFVGSVA